jgi:hypothetical protein
MFDELERLRGSPELQRLLGHYAGACGPDPEAWQDRLMELDEVEPRQLVELHGLLIAFGWLEQNTGHGPVPRPGTVPGSYRITAAGRRAGKLARGTEPVEADEALGAAGGGSAAGRGGGGDAPPPGRREGRRQKAARETRAVAGDVGLPERAAEMPAGVPG